MFGSGNFWEKSPSRFLKIMKLPSFYSGNFNILKNALGSLSQIPLPSTWLLVLISEVITIVKLILVLPATEATRERSFSMLRLISDQPQVKVAESNQLILLIEYKEKSVNFNLQELFCNILLTTVMVIYQFLGTPCNFVWLVIYGVFYL